MGCGNKVRSALEGVEGVEKASVSMPSAAVVTAKGDVSDEALIKAVVNAGYGASVAK